MQLRFDRGTLVFDEVPVGLDLGQIDGVRYDERVRAWRARACDRDGILFDLLRRGLAVDDRTARSLAPPPAPPAISLRPYQETALLAWHGRRRRGVVVLPTGAGKTRLAIAAIAQARCRALVLVPTRVLLEQWHDELGRAGFGAVGRYGDRCREMAPVTVATIESAWRWMHKLGDAFELLVIDEVHRVAGETHAEALEMSLSSWRLGLTATMPEGLAAARVESLVGPVVHVSTLDELAGTYLSPFEVVVLPVELTAAERAAYDERVGAFRAWADGELFVDPELPFQELAKRAQRTPEGRLALESLRRARAVLAYPTQKRVLLGQLLEEHRARKVLVFTADNKTAYAIAKEHLIAPITGDVPRAERAAVLARFREGTLRALVSSQVLNEGVDVPDADVAIVVGGRAGEREHVQRIGRVLRPGPGKQALVVELVVPRSSEGRAGARRRRFLTEKRRHDQPERR